MSIDNIHNDGALKILDSERSVVDSVLQSLSRKEY